ncbi:Zinc finger CCCH domain-containing protein 15 [Hibiscus syriacus]|uniref:Zinc finger CCCH domain-containing protein 15 n=1 Tax=Hibiscus syriacus TaxID=106335 RepID=A0A6A3D3K3_HIBSY|nr:zinc finger CCCH domain-containing protein 15-like isoform X2 [Hibiscus syriacus]KAE8736365.1 Zinc finger CCCH domain-containing protein 15 [Hibiscus syriacus]
MQNDNFTTVYGDLGGNLPKDHQSGGVYSSSTTTSSSTSVASAFSLYNPRILMQQHQDMINRHNLCLTRLREAAKEAEALRQENSSLRSVNRDLNKQLSVLIQASVQNHLSSSDYDTSPFELANALQGLCLGSDAVEEADISDESPTSVMEGAVDVERVMLPKSISVRSNGYLKMMNQAGASHRGKTRVPTRTGNASQLSGAQKVYVQGGKEEEEPLELEVYNQGMLKTELCNKWQETGACPYGNHCQFAHGIKELRPVIRHPRYKTEVCRMVLAGDVCPYGHRCHFRHALTEQEKFMDHLKPRTR